MKENNPTIRPWNVSFVDKDGKMSDRNQEIINHLLEKEEAMNAATAVFMTALNNAEYRTVYVGNHENTELFEVHPDYSEEAKKVADTLGHGFLDWYKEKPPGTVFRIQ